MNLSLKPWIKRTLRRLSERILADRFRELEQQLEALRSSVEGATTRLDAGERSFRALHTQTVGLEEWLRGATTRLDAAEQSLTSLEFRTVGLESHTLLLEGWLGNTTGRVGTLEEKIAPTAAEPPPPSTARHTDCSSVRSTTRRCPICRAENAPVLFDATRDPKLLICPSCRHLTWDRLPTQQELIDLYRDEYCGAHDQQNIQEQCRTYYRGHLEELLTLLGRPRGEVCLVDYGSSIPTLVHEARDMGVGRPIAVDWDEKAREYADGHGLTLLTPDEYSREVPPASVDVIRFSHVLEHLIDPAATVAEAVEKLRPGGVLYITQPNFPVLRPRRADHPLKDSVYPKHLHFFSPLSLVRMLSEFPLVVARLFSVDRAEETWSELSGLVDLDYAWENLAGLKGKGSFSRGEKANYPFYAGENSAVYALKRVA